MLILRYLARLCRSATARLRSATRSFWLCRNVSDCADVTAVDLASIKLLELRSQNITALKAYDFNGLTALEDLDLYDNELGSLPASIFDGLTALEELSLIKTGLSNLPAGIFDELTALKRLKLGRNELNLPAGIFDELTALECAPPGQQQIEQFTSGYL